MDMYQIHRIYDSAVVARFTPTGQPDVKFAGRGHVVLAGKEALDLELDASGGAVYALTHDNATSSPTLIQKIITRNSPPVVAIEGGDRTIVDTDGVPGEIVNLVATATDADSFIVSEEWLVDGVVVATGTQAMLELADGMHTISFRAADDEDATGTVSVAYEVMAPGAPLPRSACASPQGACQSEFALTARDANGDVVSEASTAETLSVAGFVFPQVEDRDTRADLFVVVATPRGWFMRNSSGAFVPWTTRVADLVPAHTDVLLTELVRVPVFATQFPEPGAYALYLGYRRVDGDVLLHMAEPTRIEVH
jgi:hypothetical protein